MTRKQIILKVIATAVLFATFVFISVLAIMLAPLYIALSMKGHAKVSTLIEIVPLGLIVGMMWRLWKPEGLTPEEKAYYDGIGEGVVKGSRKAGVRKGMSMVAYEEDLSLQPVYETRGRGRKNPDDIPF